MFSKEVYTFLKADILQSNTLQILKTSHFTFQTFRHKPYTWKKLEVQACMKESPTADNLVEEHFSFWKWTKKENFMEGMDLYDNALNLI